MSKHEDEILMTNKRAKFDYEILGTYQVGLSLSGTLVKQVRARRVNLQGKYIVFQQNQLQILAFGNDKVSENVAILLTKKEKHKVAGQLSTKGISCIPLNLKKVGRWLKADIALVKGKKSYDKRESIKKRDLDRDYRKGIA
jgi:SsrA-binding protein